MPDPTYSNSYTIFLSPMDQTPDTAEAMSMELTVYQVYETDPTTDEVATSVMAGLAAEFTDRVVTAHQGYSGYREFPPAEEV